MMTTAAEALARLERYDLKRLVEVIQRIEDQALRDSVVVLIDQAVQARERLHAIDLKPFEAARYELSGRNIWDAVASQFQDAFISVSELARTAGTLMPARDETEIDDQAFDLVFAEMDSGLTLGEWTPSEDRRGQETDDLLDSLLDEGAAGLGEQENLRERLGNVAWQVTALLRDEMSHFNRRMGLEAVATDRWNLLNEIQETRHKLLKGIGALVVGLCSVIAPVRQDEVLPGYQSELTCSLQLRACLFELRDHLEIQRDTLQRLPRERWRALAQSTFRDLEHTIFSQAFGWMRALDKRSLIQLRDRLHAAIQEEAPPRVLYEIMEDTFQFLEALNQINNREVLIEHDTQALNIALLYLEAAVQSPPELAAQPYASAIGNLVTAAGRDREIDGLIKQAKRASEDLPPQLLLEHVLRVLGTLNQ